MILKLYLGNNYISQVFFKLPNPQSLPFTTRLFLKKILGENLLCILEIIKSSNPQKMRVEGSEHCDEELSRFTSFMVCSCNSQIKKKKLKPTLDQFYTDISFRSRVLF